MKRRATAPWYLIRQQIISITCKVPSSWHINTLHNLAQTKMFWRLSICLLLQPCFPQNKNTVILNQAHWFPQTSMSYVRPSMSLLKGFLWYVPATHIPLIENHLVSYCDRALLNDLNNDWFSHNDCPTGNFHSPTICSFSKFVCFSEHASFLCCQTLMLLLSALHYW